MSTSGKKQRIGAYVLVSKIGAGSYASAYRARHIDTGVDVALKVFTLSDLANPDIQSHFDNEVSILSDVRHPFIIELFEIVENEYCKALVLEYAENGCLLDQLNKHTLTTNDVKRIFAQTVSALSYLHDTKSIMHADIKLENVLLDRNMNIRLIDFGFARQFTRDQPWMAGMCGSPAYVAPEIVNNEQYTASADIWSLGVFLYVLSIGHLPFSGSTVSSQLQSVLTAEPDIPATSGQSPGSLLKRMLRKDPRRRCKLCEIRGDSWIFDDLSRAARAVQICSLLYNQVDCLLLATMRDKGIPREQINESSAAYRELRRAKLTDAIGEADCEHPAQTYRPITVHRPMPGRENESENMQPANKKSRKSTLATMLRGVRQRQHRPSFPMYTFGDL